MASSKSWSVRGSAGWGPNRSAGVSDFATVAEVVVIAWSVACRVGLRSTVVLVFVVSVEESLGVGTSTENLTFFGGSPVFFRPLVFAAGRRLINSMRLNLSTTGLKTLSISSFRRWVSGSASVGSGASFDNTGSGAAALAPGLLLGPNSRSWISSQSSLACSCAIRCCIMASESVRVLTVAQSVSKVL